MTDNEIIKALECHKERELETCANCPFLNIDGCAYELCEQALSLINRQKADIERLQKHIQEGIDLAKQIPEMVALAQAEAIKEFAERFNKEAEKVEIDQEGDFVATDDKLYATVADWCKETSDNIVKEMVGDG